MSVATISQPKSISQPLVSIVSDKTYKKPFWFAVFLVVVWCTVLQNTIFIDESVYIFAGQAYLDHWFGNAPLADNVGALFSGLPFLYPVLAGGLDAVGGLVLVRTFSLVCIVVSMLFIRAFTRHLFDAKAGLLASIMFGFSGPVLFVGHLATFDALVMALLSAALWSSAVNNSWSSIFFVGVLLTSAVTVKYTAYIFVLPILSVMFLARFKESTATKMFLQPIGAAVVTASCLIGAFAISNDLVRSGIAFTTSNRHALSPVDGLTLVWSIPRFLFLISLAAVVGLGLLLWEKRYKLTLVSVVLVITALALPLGQMRLGEAVSFDKHLAYAALFLAPVAGWGLSRGWRNFAYIPPLIIVLLSSLMWGVFRSYDLYSWPDVSPVVSVMENNNPEGIYLSSVKDSLKYYARGPEFSGVSWEATFDIYPSGADAIRRSVQESKYAVVVVQAGSTGSVYSDVGQRVLLSALDVSPNYTFVTVPAAPGTCSCWLFYVRTSEK